MGKKKLCLKQDPCFPGAPEAAPIWGASGPSPRLGTTPREECPPTGGEAPCRAPVGSWCRGQGSCRPPVAARRRASSSSGGYGAEQQQAMVPGRPSEGGGPCRTREIKVSWRCGGPAGAPQASSSPVGSQDRGGFRGPRPVVDFHDSSGFGLESWRAGRSLHGDLRGGAGTPLGVPVTRLPALRSGPEERQTPRGMLKKLLN